MLLESKGGRLGSDDLHLASLRATGSWSRYFHATSTQRPHSALLQNSSHSSCAQTISSAAALELPCAHGLVSLHFGLAVMQIKCERLVVCEMEITESKLVNHEWVRLQDPVYYASPAFPTLAKHFQPGLLLHVQLQSREARSICWQDLVRC